MPTGPQGQKRPADVVGAAVMVTKIATGQIKETPEPEKEYRAERSRAGKKGGPARAKALSPRRRSKIAKKAAKARWGKQVAA